MSIAEKIEELAVEDAPNISRLNTLINLTAQLARSVEKPETSGLGAIRPGTALVTREQYEKALKELVRVGHSASVERLLKEGTE